LVVGGKGILVEQDQFRVIRARFHEVGKRLDLGDLAAPLQKSIVPHATSTPHEPSSARRSDHRPHKRLRLFASQNRLRRFATAFRLQFFTNGASEPTSIFNELRIVKLLFGGYVSCSRRYSKSSHLRRHLTSSRTGTRRKCA
jgi:hypothetical protein